MSNNMRGGAFLISVFTLFAVAACGQGETTNPEATTSQSGDTDQQNIEPITLTTSVWGPERTWTRGWEFFGEQVEERTGGAVTFKHHYNETLSPGSETFANLGAGLFDLAPVAAAWDPGKTPLWTVGELPLITADPLVYARAMEELSALPEMQAEMEAQNVKVLFITSLPSYEYMGDTRVESPADFQGMSVNADGVRMRVMEQLGATVVPMGPPEVYDAIERGLIEGAVLPWPGTFLAYSVPEVASSTTVIQMGAGTVPVAINLDTWNELEPAVQEIMLEVATEVPVEYSRVYGEEAEEGRQTLEDAGVEVIEFGPDDVATMREVGGQPIWDGWVQDLETDGLPGESTFNALQEAVERYTANPE